MKHPDLPPPLFVFDDFERRSLIDFLTKALSKDDLRRMPDYAIRMYIEDHINEWIKKGFNDE